MKNKKIIFNLVKVTIVIGLIVLVSKNINKINLHDWLNLKILNLDYLLFAFTLVFINWGIEWMKWIKMIDLIQLKNKKSNWVLFQSFSAGIISGVLTPNMLGNFIGRLYYFNRENRPAITLGTMLTNYSQFFASILFGVLSIVFLEETPLEIELNLYLYSLLTLVLLLLLFPYYYIEKTRISVFHKKNSLRLFFSFISKNIFFRTQILTLSIIRHFIFTLQFWLILNTFENTFNLETFFWIWQVFFWTTLIPSLWLGKLFIRESVALIILTNVGFGEIEVLSSSILLWIINLALPSVFSLFICKQKKS